MLNAGSTTRLSFCIATSMVSVGLFLYIFLTNSWLAIVPLLFAVHGLVLAVRLLDMKGSIVSAGPDGLTFSDQISSEDLLPWGEIRNVQLLSHYEGFIRIPWLDYLIVTANDLSYFDGTSRLLPSTWLGCYILPTRLIDGGADAAEKMVAAAKSLKIDAELCIEPRGDPAKRQTAGPMSVTLSSTYHTPDGAAREAMEVLLEKARMESADAPAPSQASAASFGKRGVMLNGKPLK